LIPYILRTRAKYSQCQLRVFCLAENLDNIVEETRNLTMLLQKFRIGFKDVTLIANAHTQADMSTKNQFEDLLLQIQDSNGNERKVSYLKLGVPSLT
jgi:solute carrier family 12 sodium/potassium/chloride transporter 2